MIELLASVYLAGLAIGAFAAALWCDYSVGHNKFTRKTLAGLIFWPVAIPILALLGVNDFLDEQTGGRHR